MTGQRFVFAADNHGAECDRSAVKVFHEFCQWWKPTVRIHGGDCFDFARLRKRASDEERRATIREDLEFGLQFIDAYKPTHFLRGNHDERMWDAAKSDDGGIKDIAADYVIPDIVKLLGKGCVMLPYHKRDGVLQIGDLRFLHGYSGGEGAVQKSAQVYGQCLMGHIHTIEQRPVPSLERRIARSVGCLCRLDLEYNRAQVATLKQEHGWAYGVLLKSGASIVWQARKTDGCWLFASEVKAIKG